MAYVSKGSDMTREPAETIRAFVAFELPKGIIDALARVQEQMRGLRVDARWVRPANIHMTLKFLGQVPASDIETIGRSVMEAARGRGPIVLSVRGVGVFPGVRKPRVAWVGLNDPDGGLLCLHQELETRMSSVGYPAEERPFKGHLTIGRFKGSISAPMLITALNACQDFETEAFSLDTLTLFQSELMPSGPVYTKIVRATLTNS